MSDALIKSFVKALIIGLIFFLLSPGVLLTIPPKCDGKIFLVLRDDTTCCATSYTSAIVHTMIFTLVMYVMFHYYNF